METTELCVLHLHKRNIDANVSRACKAGDNAALGRVEHGDDAEALAAGTLAVSMYTSCLGADDFCQASDGVRVITPWRAWTTQSAVLRSSDTQSHRRLEPSRPQPQASRRGGGDHLWLNITSSFPGQA